MPADQFSFILIGLNFFSLLSTLLLLLILVEHDRAHKHKKEEIEVSFMESAKEKTASLLTDSVKKANRILSNAELRGINIIAREKLDSRKLAAEYEAYIKDLETALKNRFDKSITDAQKSYSQFISELESAMKTKLTENEKTMIAHTDSYITESQTALNSLIKDVHDKVTNQVEKEMIAVRASVEEYRQRRIKIIDENIIEILEKTLRIALGKKMSLTDQSELIYKALEEAKKEHALN